MRRPKLCPISAVYIEHEDLRAARCLEQLQFPGQCNAGSTLVRLVPTWYSDAGSIQFYYASRKLLPAKTRVFVDYVVDAFRHVTSPEQLLPLA